LVIPAKGLPLRQAQGKLLAKPDGRESKKVITRINPCFHGENKDFYLSVFWYNANMNRQVTTEPADVIKRDKHGKHIQAID
jgi:hypothetical protein